MGWSLADFWVDLKVKGDTVTLKDMATSLSNMRLTTLGEIVALGTMADIFKNIASQALGTAASFTTLSSEYEINTQLLQRWQNVAVKSNVPIEAVANSFANVKKILTGFQQGVMNEGFLKGAAFLRIPNANQLSQEQLFEVLRTRVPAMIASRGRSFVTSALGMMGIEPSMIQMLSLNRQQFQARESGPIMSQAQIQNWTLMNEQINTTKRNLFLMGQEIMESAIPQILKWTQSMVDSEGWIKKRFHMAEEAVSQPWIEGRGLAGNLEHVISSLLIPDAVKRFAARDMAALERDKNKNARGTIHYTFNTDMTVNGATAESWARDYARHLEDQQRKHTTALQSVNGKVAF